jgi:hypothetical protein
MGIKTIILIKKVIVDLGQRSPGLNDVPDRRRNSQHGIAVTGKTSHLTGQ